MSLRQSYSKLPLLFGQFVDNKTFKLSDDEVKHCQVLRKQFGDFVLCTNGIGNLIAGNIFIFSKKEILVNITQLEKLDKERTYYFHLIIAPTKQNERMEWLLEKCVEMGLDEISFIICENSEKSHINIERLKKISISAIKQSRQCFLPKINDPAPFETVLKKLENGKKGIAFCSENKNKVFLKEFANKNNEIYHIAIGPEGDFTDKEIKISEQYGFEKINLGSSILRTETAGLLTCSTLKTLVGS